MMSRMNGGHAYAYDVAAEPLPEWEAVNNGASKRPWFVQRKGADHGDWPGGSHLWYHENGRGDLVRFGSRATAQRRADGLNLEEKRHA